jgi:hypothetical protein
VSLPSATSLRWPGEGRKPSVGEDRRSEDYRNIAGLISRLTAVAGAWRVVDRALDLAGGFGIFRQGPFLTHELAAKITLGIDPDEEPRWG